MIVAVNGTWALLSFGPFGGRTERSVLCCLCYPTALLLEDALLWQSFRTENKWTGEELLLVVLGGPSCVLFFWVFLLGPI